jgi:hypothetical protein
MRARIAVSILILSGLATLSSPGPTAAGPWGLAHGEWYSSLECSVFRSITERDASGVRVGSGRVVEQRALGLVNEVAWKKHTTIVFALPALSVTRRDARAQGTATGFQDVRLGMRYNLMDGASAMAVEAMWSAPAGYNRHLDSLGLQLGDGLQELSASLALGTGMFKRGFIEGSFGYGYRYLAIGQRDKGPVVAGDPHTAKYQWSDHLLASADVGLWVRPSLLIGGRYRGSLALSNGPLAKESDAHLVGPIALCRVDDRLDVLAGSWTTASGTNSIHFDQFYVGVAFHKTKLNRLQGFLGSKQAP